MPSLFFDVQEVEDTKIGIVNAKIMTLWRLPHILDTKLYSPMTKIVLEPNQEVIVYTLINYNLLRGWLDYYNLTYNNHSLDIGDFDELKKIYYSCRSIVLCMDIQVMMEKRVIE